MSNFSMSDFFPPVAVSMADFFPPAAVRKSRSKRAAGPVNPARSESCRRAWETIRANRANRVVADRVAELVHVPPVPVACMALAVRPMPGQPIAA